jgi:hypothetical protein
MARRIEIEIDDDLADRLSADSPSDKLDPSLLPARVEELVRRYSDRPKLLEPKHEIALALLRADLTRQAVQCAKPGEDAWNLNQRVNDMLTHIVAGGAYYGW